MADKAGTVPLFVVLKETQVLIVRMDGHLTLRSYILDSFHGWGSILWLCLQHDCRFQLTFTATQGIPLGSGRLVLLSRVIYLQVWQFTLIVLISADVLLLGDFGDALGDFFEFVEVCLVIFQA